MNSIYNGDFVKTGLRTIVDGIEVIAPATTAGNILESVAENEIVRTAAKTLQCVPIAFLSMGPLGIGIAALTLSIPTICEVGKYLSPENKDKFENFLKTYATAMKIVNFAVAAIALGFFVFTGVLSGLAARPVQSVAVPLALSAVSFATSAYSLYRNGQ